MLFYRRAEKYSATSGTSVILHFMRLKPEVREEVLQILLTLMHKDIPNQAYGSICEGNLLKPEVISELIILRSN